MRDRAWHQDSGKYGSEKDDIARHSAARLEDRHHHHSHRRRDDSPSSEDRDLTSSGRLKSAVERRNEEGEETRSVRDERGKRRRESDGGIERDDELGAEDRIRYKGTGHSVRLSGRDRDESLSTDERDPEGSRFPSADRRRGSRNEEEDDAFRDKHQREKRRRESSWGKEKERDRERRDERHVSVAEYRRTVVRSGRSSGRDRDDSPSSNERRPDNSSRFQSTTRSRVNRTDEGQDTWKERDGRETWRKDSDRGRERERRGDARDAAPVPELYSVHKATVHSVRPFGLFVRIEGFRNHGLVHLSQISDHEITKRDDSDAAKVEALSAVAGESDQIWVKVISVKSEEDGSVKVGCSLKYVSQGDGRDLDPNNLKLEKLQSKPAWGAPKKLELDAVYNVTCTRCGGHGHLKKECYSAGEKTYELLQEEDDSHLAAGGSEGAGAVPKILSEIGQSSMPPSGPAGRGRAMVQPAWMKHGISGDHMNGFGRTSSTLVDEEKKDRTNLPEKVTTVEEALAIIAKVKEEKRRKKERRHRKHHRREKKHSHKESKREKDRKSHRREDDLKSAKKHKV